MRATTATPTSARERQRSKAQQSYSEPNGEKGNSLQETAPRQPENYYQLVARATRDVVRDWDLATDALIWGQGLEALLGCKPASANSIAFWQKRVHPDDRERVTASIGEAIESDADHWSGEYQFRRSDGSYLSVLERAMIHRNPRGEAKRFVGVLTDMTACKHLQDQLVRSQKMEAFGQLAGGV